MLAQMLGPRPECASHSVVTSSNVSFHLAPTCMVTPLILTLHVLRCPLSWQSVNRACITGKTERAFSRIPSSAGQQLGCLVRDSIAPPMHTFRTHWSAQREKLTSVPQSGAVTLVGCVVREGRVWEDGEGAGLSGFS